MDGVAVADRSRPIDQRSSIERGSDIDGEELAWIVAAKRDIRAFVPLYDRYALRIYRYCYRKVGDVDEANDLTAQVFIKALERIDRYHPQPGGTFQSWLFTIARNTVTDFWRRRKPTSDVEAFIGILQDDSPSPETLAIEADDTRRVKHLVAYLPESQRALVELRWAGLSTKELMATLNMSESAVKSAQNRAYRRLRELVLDTEGAGS